MTRQRDYLKSHADEVAALKKQYEATPAVFYEQMKARMACEPTPLSVLIDHIEHVAKVAGVDHVGLGSDFDGVPSLPVGMEGIDKLPAITRALLERGWKDEDVKKVLGGNFLRVMQAAEDYAASTKTTISGDGSTKKSTRSSGSLASVTGHAAGIAPSRGRAARVGGRARHPRGVAPRGNFWHIVGSRRRGHPR